MKKDIGNISFDDILRWPQCVMIAIVILKIGTTTNENVSAFFNENLHNDRQECIL